jgi:tetratricopeptide (TPR) repeat protein
MRNLPGRSILIRWMFDALGFLLLFGHRFVVHSVLRADFWAGLFFGRKTAGYLFFMAAVSFYTLVTPLFCWATASGLKRNKTWWRPVGVCTSTLLLFGLPWLTIAGAIGLYVLSAAPSHLSPAADPVPTKPTTDYWASKRRSKAQPVVLTLFWMAALVPQAWLALYAHRAGMPAWRPGWAWWPWYSLFIFVNIVLHECGHAIMAWAAGFKLRIISIGPFTFWREHSRFQFRFDPARLFESGGYMGAVPVSDRNLRLYETTVVAAGPATNALTCLVLLAVFFSLPGTAWQQWWWIASFNAVIAGVMAVSNLIPVGYCDGSMLFHLIFWTPAGRLLLDRKRVTQLGEEADAFHAQAAFDKEIELRQAMLERSLAFGQDNAFMIAACHQMLGTAYSLVEDWPAAELHYRKCLEFEAEIAANPALASNVWSGLQKACIRRQHVAAAGPVYASAVAILEKRKAGVGGPARPAVTHAMLAQVHLRNGSFKTALGEIEEGLKLLPRSSNNLFLRGHLLRCEAVCRLQLGEIDAGLAAARAAADLYRSSEVPLDRRNLAWENIADLGDELASAGLSALAIDLLREGIAHLESGGAAFVAALYRIKLASVFGQLGRMDEACAELPTGRTLSPALRRAFLAERARLHMVSGRADLAVADCRELVALWMAHSCTPAPEIASAEALLAEACLAAGDHGEAAALAAQASDVLGPWQHPDAASCLITIALARSSSASDGSSALIDEAFRLIDGAALLGPVEKARMRECETARIREAHAEVLAVA